MNKNNKLRVLLCALLAAAVLAAFAAMAAGGGAGSQSDPLVTLSYLNETFTGQVMDRLDELLAEHEDGYTVVTLSAGQSLHGEAGCELLPRSGSARCEGTLVDTTSGDTLRAGAALEINHLYLLPESVSVTAGDRAVLLARGSYTVA